MKNCDEIREQISMYIDGELDETQLAEFEEHINSCVECRNELDEIKSIISMCSSIEEEELPDNFREELHSKLLAVKEETMRKNKVVKLHNRYIQIISAAAACLLIVVLTKGFLLDGFSPKHSKNDMAKTGTAETQMADEKEDTVDESAGISGFSVENDTASGSAELEGSNDETDGVQQFSIMAEPKTEKSLTNGTGDTVSNGTGDTVSDGAGDIVSRSTVPSERKHFLQRSDEGNVYSNNVIINAKVNGELDSEIQNIRELAVDVGGEFSEQSAEIALAKEQQNAVGENGTETVLSFKILYNQYQNFFDSLTEYVGTENITADKSSQDMSNIIESYKIRLNEIEDEISRIEKSENTSSPDVLESLNEERQNIINEIEKIMLDSDYIYVTIYIQHE